MDFVSNMEYERGTGWAEQSSPAPARGVKTAQQLEVRAAWGNSAEPIVQQITLVYNSKAKMIVLGFLKGPLCQLPGHW